MFNYVNHCRRNQVIVLNAELTNCTKIGAQSWLWAAEMQGDLLFHCVSANLPCNLRNFNLLMLMYIFRRVVYRICNIYNDMELEDSCITREVTTHYYPLFLS